MRGEIKMKKFVKAAVVAAALLIGFAAGARLTVLTAQIEVGQGEVYMTTWGQTDVFDLCC